MNELEKLGIRCALHDLNAVFVRYLDENDVTALIDLFTADAVYTHGSRISEGRAAINEFLMGRARLGPRTTRHVISGLVVELEGEARARGRSVCMLFSADGLPPAQANIPQVIADFVDQYARGEDGVWRIARRDIIRVFTAPGNTGPVGAPKPG